MVSDLSDAIPEAMFTDYDRFSAEQHPAWLNAVLEAEGVEGLKTAVCSLPRRFGVTQTPQNEASRSLTLCQTDITMLHSTARIWP